MANQNIPCKLKKVLDDFVSRIKDAYGEELVSAVLYGSVASGEYSGKYSNINIAIVLKDASLNNLNKAKPIFCRNKFSAINPVFFTESYIDDSIDVFPLEFLDIKENHIILHGKDVFAGINIDLKNLRFQCEQELKSKILNIKKLYLKTKSNIILRNFLFKFLTSSLHILRNLIRLKGKEPAYDKEGILDGISREFAADVSCLRKILDAKNKNIRLSHKDTRELFSCLIEMLENVSGKVNKI